MPNEVNLTVIVSPASPIASYAVMKIGDGRYRGHRREGGYSEQEVTPGYLEIAGPCHLSTLRLTGSFTDCRRSGIWRAQPHVIRW